MTDDKQSGGLVASGLWRRLAGTGLERFELLRDRSDWVQRGTILMVSQGSPFEARYEVRTDSGPATNTLPIRRLGLEVGHSRAVTAAWVRFPDLELEPLAQEYRRLTERRYRYSSAQGSFVAEIDVDDDALVVEYSGQWQRVGNG